MSTKNETKPMPSRLLRICGLIVALCVLVLMGNSLFTSNDATPTPSPEGEISVDLPAVDALSDYLTSPCYLASTQWNDFLLSYDPDGSKLANAMGTEEIGQGYTLYRVYTSEMANKLDQLCANHSLNLNRTMSFFYSAAELFESAGTGEFIGRENECVGYLFDSGSFHVESSYREVDFRFELQKKQSFSETMLPMAQSGDERWVYLSHGTPLLLSMGNEQCLIHTELKGCYITLTVPQGAAREDAVGISGAFLESLADSIYWDRIEG